MTFLESVKVLRTRITGLNELQKSVHERQMAAQRNQELEERNAALSQTIRPLRWLKVKPTEYEAVVINARQNVGKFKQALAEGKSVDALTKGQIWAQFLSQLNSSSRAIQEIAKRKWKERIDTDASLPNPDEISRALAGTPKNLAVLNDYRTQYSRLTELTALALPRQEQDLSDLVTRAEKLREIRDRFDFSVPSTVKDFLDAASSSDGAGLELLNDEVRTWLDEQRLAGHYVVRAKGR